MADHQPFKTIDINTFPKNAELVIPMLPKFDTNIGGKTVLKIIKAGVEPLVDCTRTEDGTTIGPEMIFLGSVAYFGALQEEGGLLRGVIAGNHRLVLADNNEASIPHLVSGIVDPDLAIIERRKR